MAERSKKTNSLKLRVVTYHVANVATKVGMPIKLTIDNNYNDNTAEPNSSVNGLVNQHC